MVDLQLPGVNYMSTFFKRSYFILLCVFAIPMCYLYGERVDPLKLSKCTSITATPKGLLVSGVSNMQFTTGFRVDIDNQKYSVSCMAGRGDFSFVIPVDPQLVNDSLIKFTPLVNDDEGTPFYYLYNSRLPLPSYTDVQWIGGGEFISMGSHLFSILKEYGGLKDTDVVLDVGCGCGRAAYPLAYYLKPSALYFGFDIIAGLINRAQVSVTPHFPNFNFYWANVFNSAYNPLSTELPGNFRFPYGDNVFDFVLLTSVFTHMLSGDVKHYLDEIKRVLKPGGKCMLTAFLIDETAYYCIEENKNKIKFPYFYNDCLVGSLEQPESAVAYSESAFASWIIDRGFIYKAIYRGDWSGRTDFTLSLQDFVLISKP